MIEFPKKKKCIRCFGIGFFKREDIIELNGVKLRVGYYNHTHKGCGEFPIIQCPICKTLDVRGNEQEFGDKKEISYKCQKSDCGHIFDYTL